MHGAQPVPVRGGEMGRVFTDSQLGSPPSLPALGLPSPSWAVPRLGSLPTSQRQMPLQLHAGEEHFLSFSWLQATRPVNHRA